MPGVDVQRVGREHLPSAEAARRPVVVVGARRVLVDGPAVVARVVHVCTVRVDLVGRRSLENLFKKKYFHARVGLCVIGFLH